MFNWFWEFLYGLVKVAFYCIDFILKIAQMLCGIVPVTVEEGGTTKRTDILQHFLSSNEIMDAFIVVAVVGFILLFLFTAFAILRSQVKDGENKTPARICFESAKTLLYFFMVPGIMILGSIFVATIMTAVFNATSLGDGSLGASLFAIMAEEAYEGSENVQDVLDRFISGELDYYSTTQVQSYFDLSEMNYFLGFVGGLSILLLLALSMLTFVDRIISLVVLFVISPLSMSTAALDGGARFKLWRDQVINKFLIAYGALICLNIFVLMLSVVQRIEFFDSNFMNSLAQLFFAIGGAFACYKGTALVGNLINSGAGSQDLSDRAFSNGMFGRVAGAATGVLRGTLGKVTGAATDSVKRKASAAVHRGSNAKREAKAMLARDRYMEKYSGKGSQAQNVQTALKAGGKPANGTAPSANADAAPKGTDQAAQVREALSGGVVAADAPTQDNGNDSKVNQEASRKIVEAMPTRDDGPNGKD